MSIIRKQFGKQGENYVADHLKKQGFILLAHNYVQRCGEIDLIVQNTQENLLVFVEVKMRTATYFPLSELIPFSKQKKIVKTALYYILTHERHHMTYRFDVALLEFSPDGQYTMNYIANAFTAPCSGLLL